MKTPTEIQEILTAKGGTQKISKSVSMAGNIIKFHGIFQGSHRPNGINALRWSAENKSWERIEGITERIALICMNAINEL